MSHAFTTDDYDADSFGDRRQLYRSVPDDGGRKLGGYSSGDRIVLPAEGLAKQDDLPASLVDRARCGEFESVSVPRDEVTGSDAEATARGRKPGASNALPLIVDD